MIDIKKKKKQLEIALQLLIKGYMWKKKNCEPLSCIT